MRFNGLLGLAIAALTLAAPTARAACVFAKVADLPVTMDGMRPLVSAKFNGRDIRMIADSGAFYSMIPQATSAQYGLSLRPLPSGIGIRQGIHDIHAQIATVDKFTLGGSNLNKVDFLVGGTDFGQGLLGQNIIGAFDAEYDLSEGVVRLFRTTGCGEANLAYWAATKPIVVLRLEDDNTLINPLPVIRVKLNGISVDALLNTAAGPSVLTLGAARRAGIDLTGLAESRGSNGLARVKISRIEIGEETISNAKIGINNDKDAAYALVLGADFFVSHRLLISYSQHRVYLTYQGGPVFDAAEHPQLAATNRALAETAEPTDAEGYSRLGAALLARGDAEGALADFDKAVAGAPKEPSYLVQRAEAHWLARRPVMTMSDIDAALALDPGDVDALMLRAVLRSRNGDEIGELADLDAATKSMAPQAARRLQLGQLYLGADHFEAAVAEFDQWIRYHADDARLGDALNDRCWARALEGRQLDQALSDCNRAVGIYPNSAQVRDSRGLVRLRRGEYARAIADYNAALRIAPKMAWSLYGRGLAELKTGAPAAGEADIAAAEALAPKLAERARRFGLASDTGNAALPSSPTASGAPPPV